jgi:hypothetical protein
VPSSSPAALRRDCSSFIPGEQPRRVDSVSRFGFVRGDTEQRAELDLDETKLAAKPRRKSSCETTLGQNRPADVRGRLSELADDAIALASRAELLEAIRRS